MQFNLEILRAGVTVCSFDIDEKTFYSEQFLTEKVISCTVIQPVALPIAIDDYIIFEGKEYTVNEPWTVKESDGQIYYAITFEDEIYKLLRKKIKDAIGRRVFPYYGDAQNYLQLIVDYMNTILPGWSVGRVDLGEEQYITFDNDNCRTALTKIADAFKLEFYNDGKVLNLVNRVGRDLDITFEYGMSNGLYELELQSLDDSGITTRMFGYGGSQNIRAGYRDSVGELMFEGQYLERNTDIYGVREGDYIDPLIFPKRTGSVTATASLKTFVDSSMDFDLNDCFIQGVQAQVSVKSGELQGKDFNIKRYDHLTKTIYLDELKEGDMVYPSDLRKLQIGDQYVYLGIEMPDTYVSNAEDDLEDATEESLAENSIPRVSYALVIDEKHVRDTNCYLKVGDRPIIKSTKLGINNRLRVTAVRYPLVNPAKITATVGNVTVYHPIDRLDIETKSNANAIKKVANQIANTKPITGAFLSFRGEYDSETTYYGGRDRVEVVKYEGNAYHSLTTSGTFKGFTPTNTIKWQQFDGQFESLATGLLLADLAYIENLGVRYLQTSDVGKAVVINGDQNNIMFLDELRKTVVSIDLDAAVEEGTYESPGALTDFNGNPQWISSRPIYYPPPAPPGEVWYFMYKYLAKGAGLQVGYGLRDAGGYSAVGRKVIMTTGKIEARNPLGTEKTSITKEGLTTTGNVVTEGIVFSPTSTINGTIPLDGIVKVGATLGTRFPGIEVKKGMVVDAGLYLTATTPVVGSVDNVR